MAIELIAPTMAAAQSKVTRVNGLDRQSLESSHIESTVFATGITGVATVTINVRGNDGTLSALVVDGVTQRLNAQNTALVIRGCLPVVVTKSGSAEAVGVYLSTPFDV